MLSFSNDYSEGACPEILQRLTEENLNPSPGYGTDRHCAAAAEKIKAACGCPGAVVFFLTGGTQTNQIVIDTLLAPYEGVIAAQTGHVNAHEAGAVEFTGHKVLALPEYQGKLSAADLKRFIKSFRQDASREHMVFPGMVYLSHPTEYGTLYTRKELEEISGVCRKYDIPLFLDGARLAYGLTAPGTDVTLQDIARLADVFYIGGTKAGALFGEAVVFARRPMPVHFVTRVKQHGALLAKGFLLGLQFDVLFTDDLYYRLGRHANETAQKLRRGLAGLGLPLYIDSPTNQQFVELPDTVLAALTERGVSYGFWEKRLPEKTVVRFATSWSTRPESVEELLTVLREVL